MIKTINNDNWSIRKENEICNVPEFIQSNKFMVVAFVSPDIKPKKIATAIIKEARIVPLANTPANDLEILLFPKPRMMKPIRGKIGISHAYCIIIENLSYHFNLFNILISID